MSNIKKKVKVLYFVDRMLRGGIQTFVLDNMCHMNKDKVHIDYLLLDDGVDYELEDTLRDLGSNVFKLKDIWLRSVKDYIKYYKSLDAFFVENHDYKVVHMHSSSKNFMVLYFAKKYGIEVRIAHSHNIGFQSKSKIQIMIGNLLKYPLKRYATHYFACSELAGEWMFGKKAVRAGKVTIVHNAVDVKKFAFDSDLRDKMRSKLNLENQLVIGHIGRFTDQKNHTFLIDIFLEIHKQKQNSKLILVGSGDKESEIKEKVDALGLSDSVLFVGFKSNVSDYMQSMDVFLFPSKFEGLGLVLIEAQAAGLPSFTSANVVPEEAKVTNLLQYISLKESAETWSKIILDTTLERKDTYNEICTAGYEIIGAAYKLEKFYLNRLE